jgi:hypothetical protein
MRYAKQISGLLEGPATAQAQERGPDSVGTGSIGASVPLVLKKKRIKMGWYTETARTSSRKRSRRSVLRREQLKELDMYHHQDWTTDEQQEQLEINRHENWTADTSRKNGLLYSVRPFGTNSLKEVAV